MSKDRAREKRRNLFSHYDRRLQLKQSRYSKDSICPGCGRTVVGKRKLCSECIKNIK